MDYPTLFQHFAKWYQSSLGQTVYGATLARLSTHLPRLYGQHLLQMGVVTSPAWLESSRITHRNMIGFHPQRRAVAACVDPTHLPFDQTSVDVVFLPHTLSLVAEPLAFLTEIKRILVAEGHVLIVGFNPISWWGMAKWLHCGKPIPWTGQWYSALQMQTLLRQQGFRIEACDRFLYFPPWPSMAKSKMYPILETIGLTTLSLASGAYLIVAKKQLSVITPIRPNWSRTKFTFSSESPQSTAFRQ